jgi:hypothetical protein
MVQRRRQLRGLFVERIAKNPWFLAVLVGTGAVFASSGKAGTKGLRTMEGSAHDFSRVPWHTSHNTCVPCHQGKAGSLSISSLAQGRTAGAFTPYNSPTFKAGPHQPGGVSLLCLSCHDGTLASNQFAEGGTGVNQGFAIGPDLHTSHPISFVYDSALSMADRGLEDPRIYRIGDPKRDLRISVAPVPPAWSGSSLSGKTIDEALLVDHKLECTSCHDVHKLDGSSPSNPYLLRIAGTDSSGRGDLLCRTCHIK